MLKVVADYFEEEEKEEEKVYILEKAYRDEVVYWVENYNNNEDNEIDLTDEEVNLIASLMLEDNELNVEIDNTMEYYIRHKFSEKFESEEK